MHSAETRRSATALAASGLPDAEIARRLGVDRSTIRAWRRSATPGPATCPRCWKPTRPVALDPAAYAYLLGLYLGDGCIADAGRTQRLRLSLDAKWPGIIAAAESTLVRAFPSNRVGRVAADAGATTVLSLYSGHLTCLFPQHGPGRKHLRRIVLEPWQEQVVAAAPWDLLRGLIHSDGCVFVNRTGPYEYLCYDFFNYSRDLLGLFSAVCSSLGVDHRVYERRVRVYRRASVALLEAHVGAKS